MAQLDKVVVSSSPHIKISDGTTTIMTDVIIALMPALVIAVLNFGYRALVLTVISVLVCVITELIFNKLAKQDITITDLSAVITGILLAYNVPVTLPIWTLVIGDIFAIIIVKMIFGGIGNNFINPALGGRMFLFSWTSLMTTWTIPKYELPLLANPVDVITTATPLAQMKEGSMPTAEVLDMLLGQTAGCIGETSALALILGGCYLLYTKVITITIPITYIATVFFASFYFVPLGGNLLEYALAQILSGGLMLGAIFMATDYTTSPVTFKGQIVFGIGCGLLTMLIRCFGGLVEGVSFAIVIMNSLVFLIDKYTMPKRFGATKRLKKNKEVADE